MRALVLLFLLTIATRAGADCENLCDDEWWKTATIDDIKNELDAGIDVMSRDAEGITPTDMVALSSFRRDLLSPSRFLLRSPALSFAPPPQPRESLPLRKQDET